MQFQLSNRSVEHGSAVVVRGYDSHDIPNHFLEARVAGQSSPQLFLKQSGDQYVFDVLFGNLVRGGD